MQCLYPLHDVSNVLVGHDYQPGSREIKSKTSIGEQTANTIQLKDGVTEAKFTQFRATRDKDLNAPKLLFQSIQVNIDAGELPDAEDSGKSYLKIPVNIFRPEPKGELELSQV